MQTVKYFLVSTSLLLMAQRTWAMEERKDENESFSVRATSQGASRNKEDEKSLRRASRGIGSEEGGARDKTTARSSLALEQSVVTDASAENLTNLVIGKAHIEILHSEILTHIFTFLDMKDLGKVVLVSSSWKAILDARDVWRIIGLRKYSEYLTEDDLKTNPKETVVLHSLSVHVNALSDLQEIDRIVRRYRLDLYEPPFNKHAFSPKDKISKVLLYMIKNIVYKEELIAQSNKSAILQKIEGLSGEKSNDYKKNSVAARKFIDTLVENGNQMAVDIKMLGLSNGKYGYEKSPVAVIELNDSLVEKRDQEAINRKAAGTFSVRLDQNRGNGLYTIHITSVGQSELNDSLVEKGDQNAIERKIIGLSNGAYGYEKSSAMARELNDSLIEKGDQKAIKRKIKGLAEGEYGYEKNPITARELNESLIEQGDQEALNRKYRGLSYGWYGYEKSLTAARELNDFFGDKGDQEAIDRKYWGFLHGLDGYEKNPSAAREINDDLVEKGDQRAINRKLEGLWRGGDPGPSIPPHWSNDYRGGREKPYPTYGYNKDPQSARKFNETLIDKGDQNAVERKIKGLSNGEYGYEKSSETARELNDKLIEKGDQKAIKRKIKGLAKGKYGYEKNSEATEEFYDTLVEKGNVGAIMRKVMGICMNSETIRIFIENDLIIRSHSIVRGIGYYLKVMGLKYGIFGYERDREKAIEYIKEFGVPF